MFLPVGSGSGMLPGGGSFVSLVSPDGCGEGQRGGDTDTDTATDLTVVIQTMECKSTSAPPRNKKWSTRNGDEFTTFSFGHKDIK